MTLYLTFALVAPMGSFGDLAGHEHRGSHVWPGRSAIFGLIGAAMGVRRDDAVGQGALDVWRMAVAVLDAGRSFEDFHTVQTVPGARIRRPDTRRAALAALTRKDNAVITRRSYRTDCAFSVAIWGGDLDAARSALERPVFTPFLGRKSCPLSAPMAPLVVTAESAVDALALARLPQAYQDRKPLIIASDEAKQGAREETRWDDPRDRDGWHFARRKVYVTGGGGA